MAMLENEEEKQAEDTDLDEPCMVYGVSTPSTPCSCYPEEPDDA